MALNRLKLSDYINVSEKPFTRRKWVLNMTTTTTVTEPSSGGLQTNMKTRPEAMFRLSSPGGRTDNTVENLRSKRRR
jgi:hypothetical protein